MGTVEYVWDVEADAVLMEADENHNTTAAYTYEPAPYGRVVSQRKQGTTETLHFDALGSTREISDESEQVVGTNMYDAWGVNRERTGPAETPFEWVGEVGYYFDHDLGSYYVRERPLVPATGRWNALDPLQIEGYRYVENSPSQFIDPSGLRCQIPKGTPATVEEVGPTVAFNRSITLDDLTYHYIISGGAEARGWAEAMVNCQNCCYAVFFGQKEGVDYKRMEKDNYGWAVHENRQQSVRAASAQFLRMFGVVPGFKGKAVNHPIFGAGTGLPALTVYVEGKRQGCAETWIECSVAHNIVVAGAPGLKLDTKDIEKLATIVTATGVLTAEAATVAAISKAINAVSKKLFKGIPTLKIQGPGGVVHEIAYDCADGTSGGPQIVAQGKIGAKGGITIERPKEKSS